MTTALLLVLGLALAGPDSRRGSPGPDAARAYALFDAQDLSAACKALGEMARSGSTDPWVARGMASCLADKPLKSLIDAMASEPEPLRTLAIAFHHYLRGDNASAERSARRALELDPDLTLGWNLLAVVVRSAGQDDLAAEYLLRSQELAPASEIERLSQDQAEAAAAALAPLVAVLRDLPTRWAALPPAQPGSGRTLEQLLAEASRVGGAAARERMAAISFATAEERPLALKQILEGSTFKEVDLFTPAVLVEAAAVRDRTAALSLVEAWIWLGYGSGRRDVLFYAASQAATLALQDLPPTQVLDLLDPWVGLDPGADPSSQAARARLLGVRAQTLTRAGRATEALDACKAARDLLAGLKDVRGEADAWRGEGEALAALGRDRDSLASFQKARELYLRQKDRAGQAETWLGEAEALLHLGQAAPSATAFQTARSLFVAVDARLGQARGWAGEARALLALGRESEALTASGKARALFEEVGDRKGLAEAGYVEAGILTQVGRSTDALDRYHGTQGLLASLGDVPGQARALEGEARLLLRIGRYDEAVEGFRMARSLLGPGGASNAALRAGEGLGLRLSGHHEEALGVYGDALASLGSEDAQGREALHLGMGIALYRLERWEEALTHIQRSSLVSSETRIAEAWTLYRLGRDGEAATVAAEAARGTARLDRAAAAGVQARALLRMGKTREAEQATLVAVQALQEWRGAGRPCADPTWLPEALSAPTGLLPVLAADPARWGDLLAAVEVAVAPTLYDRVAAGQVLPTGVDLRAERLRLEKILKETSLASGLALDARTARSIEQRRQAATVTLRSVETAWLGRVGGPLVGAAATLGSDALRKGVDATGPVLALVPLDDTVVSVLALPGQPVAVRSAPVESLASRVQSLRRALANPSPPGTAEALALGLWKDLVAPFADRIPAGPLALVAGGDLASLPFAALRDDGGKPMGERWSLTLAPSLTALAWMNGRISGEKPRLFLGIASPEGWFLPQPGLTRMGSSLSQARTIAVPDRPTPRVVLEKAPTASEILFGGVRQGPPQEPFGDSLPLSPAGSGLRAGDIPWAPWRAGVVVMPWTGPEDPGHLDLSQAVLVAGASSVLLPLWDVPSTEASRQFVADFLRGVAVDGRRRDLALAEARRLARERGDPASSWAPWVLVGLGG